MRRPWIELTTFVGSSRRYPDDDGGLGQKRGSLLRRGVVRVSLDLLVNFEDH